MKAKNLDDEAEIAKVAKVFFEINNWNMFPEVVIQVFNGRPDFIAVKNNFLCKAVECKTSLSYPVIEQLARWQLDAKKRLESKYSLNVAVPHLLVAFVNKGSAGLSDLKKHILKEFRIGVYCVSKEMYWNVFNKDRTTPFFESENSDYWKLVIDEWVYTISLEVSPRVQPGSRKTAQKIIDLLNDDMKCTDAGLKGSEADFMTPFKRTMNRVEQILSDGKERHIQTIINEMKLIGGHHYSSDKAACNNIPSFIDKFKIARRSQSYGPWFIRDLA